MKEKFGNMFNFQADAYCVTTNGIVKSNGRAVMGAGVALSAATIYPDCDKHLGRFIRANGHKVGVFHTTNNLDNNISLISFPTKYHWKDPSDIKLIEKSAKELMEIIDKNLYNVVVLTRPGVGCGGLKWEDVKKVIEPILDDRVIIVSL